MTTLLLTGSTGFIGTYFQDQFQGRYKIKTFSFLRDDFNKLDLTGVSAVIHLSALVHQMKKEPTYDEYFKVNLEQTIQIAKKAKESGVKQFVFMSTVKVYGEETNKAYEENSICNPEDNYGESKLKAERELQKLENRNFIVSIIRTPIVYGAGVKANIKNLVALVQKAPILPFGSINNKRSFVYVGNLCDMVDRIIQTKKSGIFLAADDEPISITELIQLISRAMGKKTVLIKIPLFESLLKRLKPSIHKRLYGNLIVDNAFTKQKLNFKNRYSTKQGIELMLKDGN